jgi:hypothetical protein
MRIHADPLSETLPLPMNKKTLLIIGELGRNYNLKHGLVGLVGLRELLGDEAQRGLLLGLAQGLHQVLHQRLQLLKRQ